tara:strand:+ start:1425 stop:1826 length:402 start_codon:yes stop_codon:yes gene_type:complete
MSVTENYYQYFVEKEKNKNNKHKTYNVSEKTTYDYNSRRKYYLKNRDKIIEYCKKYYQDNKEAIREKNRNNKYINKLYYKKWYDENKLNVNYRRSKKLIHDKYIVLENVNDSIKSEPVKVKGSDPKDFILYFN